VSECITNTHSFCLCIWCLCLLAQSKEDPQIPCMYDVPASKFGFLQRVADIDLGRANWNTTLEHKLETTVENQAYLIYRTFVLGC